MLVDIAWAGNIRCHAHLCGSKGTRPLPWALVTIYHVWRVIHRTPTKPAWLCDPPLSHRAWWRVDPRGNCNIAITEVGGVEKVALHKTFTYNPPGHWAGGLYVDFMETSQDHVLGLTNVCVYGTRG